MIRLLFTSGRGPAECRIAVRKAVATLAAEAAVLGLETDCLEGPNADGHGPASAIVVVHGDAAAAFARPWIGAIQWVAQSPLRPHHKRKNWFIGVFELPALPDAPKALAVQDVRFDAFRAGGPRRPASEQDRERGARHPHRERRLRRGAGRALAAPKQGAGLGADCRAAQAAGRTASDHRAERCACGA
jgi:hypothetical protein